MKQIFRPLILISACCLSLGASLFAAADDSEALLAQLSGTESLQGNFIQQQYHSDSSVAIKSTGRFKLLRPGYFSWEIESPDSQLIIATPEYLWQHDRDLETVTRRPMGGSQAMSPLQVLGGDAAALSEQYQVTAQGQGRFLLTPQAEQSAFKSLVVSFAQQQLIGMEIVDNLGQRVVVDFSRLDRSPLSAADFDFSPPPGADLFYYDE
ncbi:outer membrane lipoprotein chaperone LolA [Parahaliea sp. F7430]|uniref:Outer-membrane lipoprotein carrier protein n=1 Tax=Sediminihaliea albiluteola TaxID=2758564 RepID=A0A7W2TUR4_9GAMM|nr:outer membrane lipoprotein chaperone LolA [Sediminihaliea albiluteola]MBA6412314.1 outer membrane lipoprotein chaperone LolA [Sediminihaliea albiluteola]